MSIPKKLFSLLFITVILLTPIKISADDKPIVFDFYFESAYYEYTGTATNVEVEWVENHLHLLTLKGPDQGGNGDPYFMLTMDPFDGDEYVWCKLRIKNNSNASYFQFHFDAGQGIKAETNTLIPISKDDEEFTEYVFNMKEANLVTAEWTQSTSYPFYLEESMWTGTIRSIRLDCMFENFPGGQIETNSEFDLEYIAFFTTEEEAKNFTPDRTVTPTPEPTATPKVTPTLEKTPSPTSTTSTSEDNNEGDGFPIQYILIIVAAAIVIAVVVYIVIKKKKK